QGCVVAAGVVELQVVRRHVVAGVAQVREEAVADAQRGGGGARGDQADGDGRGEQRGGRAPPAGARDGGGEGAAVGGPAGGSERHAPRLSARAPATATTRFRRTRSGAPGDGPYAGCGSPPTGPGRRRPPHVPGGRRERGGPADAGVAGAPVAPGRSPPHVSVRGAGGAVPARRRVREPADGSRRGPLPPVPAQARTGAGPALTRDRPSPAIRPHARAA